MRSQFHVFEWNVTNRFSGFRRFLYVLSEDNDLFFPRCSLSLLFGILHMPFLVSVFCHLQASHILYCMFVGERAVALCAQQREWQREWPVNIAILQVMIYLQAWWFLPPLAIYVLWPWWLLHMRVDAQFPHNDHSSWILSVVYVQLEIVKGKQRAAWKKETGHLDTYNHLEAKWDYKLNVLAPENNPRSIQMSLSGLFNNKETKLTENILE